MCREKRRLQVIHIYLDENEQKPDSSEDYARRMVKAEDVACVTDKHVNEDSISWLSSYLVWVGVKFSNAKEEELLINDASQIGSKKFDFSIE